VKNTVSLIWNITEKYSKCCEQEARETCTYSTALRSEVVRVACPHCPTPPKKLVISMYYIDEIKM
jgi:hypothetical protein